MELLHERAMGVPDLIMACSRPEPEHLVSLLFRHRVRCWLSAWPPVLVILSAFTPLGEPAVEISLKEANPIRINNPALHQQSPQARLVEGAELLPHESSGQHGAVHIARIMVKLHLNRDRADPGYVARCPLLAPVEA